MRFLQIFKFEYKAFQLFFNLEISFRIPDVETDFCMHVHANVRVFQIRILGMLSFIRQLDQNLFLLARADLRMLHVIRVKKPSARKEARREEICQRKTEIMLPRNKNVGRSNTRIRNFVRKVGSGRKQSKKIQRVAICGTLCQSSIVIVTSHESLRKCIVPRETAISYLNLSPFG